MVVAFCPVPSDKWHADTSSQRLVDFRLVLELRVFCLDRLEFDGDFLGSDDVDTKIDITLSQGQT